MNKWNYIEKTFVDKFKIFPVIENGKTPVMNNWLNDCSSEYMQVLYWYENNHNYNWGLPAEPNNLFILDVDCKEGQCGKDSLARLMYDLDIDITKTLIQKTASGGLHLIYKSDVELNQVLNSSNSFENYPNIDIRTKGYIVVEAPWWKPTYFEVHFENADRVERYTDRFLGDGLRYEISDFLYSIHGNEKHSFKLTRGESIVMAKIMESFLKIRRKY